MKHHETKHNHNWLTGYRASNTQQRKRLPANNRIYNTNNTSTQQRLRRSQIPLGLSIHQLGKYQRRNQLHHECKYYSVDDREDGFGTGPVWFVVGEEACGEIGADSGEELEELFWFAVVVAVLLRGGLCVDDVEGWW